MRFGFMLFPYDRYAGPEDIAAVVQAADRLGYYAVELAEHLLPPAASEEMFGNRNWYDNFSLGTYVTSATTRIRPLLHVVFPYHNPVTLAKSLATLDVLSGGRLLCNVAAGWMKEEFESLGVPFDQRGAMTDEYMRIVQLLWESNRPAFAGRFISFRDVTFYPKPLQKPRVPLLVGGTGPRPWKRAAEFGDGWQPMRGSLSLVKQGIEAIRARALELRRDPAKFHFGYNALAVDVDATLETARRHAGDPRADSRRRSAEELIEQVRRFPGRRRELPDDLLRLADASRPDRPAGGVLARCHARLCLSARGPARRWRSFDSSFARPTNASTKLSGNQ